MDFLSDVFENIKNSKANSNVKSTKESRAKNKLMKKNEKNELDQLKNNAIIDQLKNDAITKQNEGNAPIKALLDYIVERERISKEVPKQKKKRIITDDRREQLKFQLQNGRKKITENRALRLEAKKLETNQNEQNETKLETKVETVKYLELISAVPITVVPAPVIEPIIVVPAPITVVPAPVPIIKNH